MYPSRGRLIFTDGALIGSRKDTLVAFCASETVHTSFG
jgi:hypothetical protein